MASNDGVLIIDCVPLFRRLGVERPNCTYAWFVKDVCGIVCVIITWCLLGYAAFVVLIVLLLPSLDHLTSVIHAFVFIFLIFMCLSSHTRAMLTDPGSVPVGTATQENVEILRRLTSEILYKCPKCISIKPDRAHHCSVCRRCIRKMDHHCPWVNNCVGEANQKYFVLFTLYIMVSSCHASYICISYFISCATIDWKDCTYFAAPITTLFLIFLLFEAVLFGIFTAIMFSTQLSSICSDETGIENLKKEHRDGHSSITNSFKSVFGHPFGLHWLSPFSTPKHMSPRAENSCPYVV